MQGRISKAGDPDVRHALYEAANCLLHRYKKPDRIKEWGLNLAKKKCHNQACIAIARKLAVVMHAMWTDGTCYEGGAESVPVDPAGKLYHCEPRTLAVAA